MTHSAATDLELMRATAALDADPATAARLASGVLEQAPDHATARLLLATACRKLGDANAATATLEALARAHPSALVLQLELGRAYAAAGRGAEAQAAFEQAVTLDPGLADAWRELAAQRFAEGDLHGGDAAYLHFSRLAPDPPYLIDAQVALASNRLAMADTLALQCLYTRPGDAASLHLLAKIAERRGERAALERYLHQCLEVAPGHAEARYDLARMLYEQERVDEVLPLVERLLVSEPGNVNYRCLKAQTLRLAGRSEQALALMQQTVAELSSEAQAWIVYGYLRRESGEQAEAVNAYRQALAVQPDCGEAYWALANLKTLPLTAADRAVMLELARSKTLGPSRVHIEFALGKAFEDESEFAESFDHYARGNNLRRSQRDYSAAATTDYTTQCKALYTAKFFADRSTWGVDSREPIFIVGMPRSGSTLLEQILASHSQVEGTRELPFVPAIAQALASGPDGTEARKYADQLGSLGEAHIGELAAQYLRKAQDHRPLGRPRFVDKMLGNFSHLGLIHLMFPRATIIDTRRHPLGCGFSCFKQLFARGMNFCYDLEELGQYYRDYADLLAHIDSVLPGRVYRVHYEHLVADPEGEVRRLLEHCQLLFEPGCLRFHENPRRVQTVSSEQVRRPIYAEAVDHWRHYEPWLGPMKAVLGGLASSYPSPAKQKKTAD